MYSFLNPEPVNHSIQGSDCCFLTCIQVSQETGKMVLWSYLFKNCLQFVRIHRVKYFRLVIDCSHEIKDDCFLAGKLWQTLTAVKSKDITLLTEVHIVKAMVFPVVMYRCESQTIKKAEGQRIDAFELGCWRRLLRLRQSLGKQGDQTSQS